MIRREGPDLRRSRRGFTLIELGIVVAIIGILISLVLVASREGVERARVRATQATITKLDTGITERLDAILNQRVDPNGAHQYMAVIRPSTLVNPGTPTAGDPATIAYYWGLSSETRAQVIATFDHLKAEMPDVFVINTGDMEYPLNFAGLHYPDPTGTAPSSANRAGFVLPLGHMVAGYRPDTYNATGVPINLGPGANWITPTGQAVNGATPAINSTGIYGASYDARAALNQLLGISPRGCDKVDNDGNGWIDELTPAETGMSAADINSIVAKLANHTHTTARSEVLYALLIGGQGPLGAIFTEEDFSPNEIGDTDDDGLPEFLDAWGKPLQFYRWPIHFSSPTGPSLQKGRNFYAGPIEARQTSPLDPNQLLVAPGWFMSSVNDGPSPFTAAGPLSGRAQAFGLYFHSLVDPNSAGGAAVGQLWERGVASISTSPIAARRAYYTRPLIVSGGPDNQIGTAQLGFDYNQYSMPNGASPPAVVPASALAVQIAEGTASNLAPNRTFGSAPYYPVDASGGALTYALGDQTEGWALDDITNQTIQNTAGGTGQ